ncbi:MAG: methyltransferase domain-containing protein [Rhizobiales bacterium]|nr:methyltransferase domain-containing protein [Hyphomicrobiales bacterium]
MATQQSRPDVWAAGDAYEPYIGRWSRLVARAFIAWLALPPKQRWLDVGCGTGAVTQTILDCAEAAEVTGVDPSEGFVAVARSRTRDPRASFQIGDAQKLPLGDATADVAVSGLVLNFIPDPAKAIAEMRRVVRPGGTVALYVWDYAGEMQLIRRFWEAAIALDPSARDLDEARRFPICRPESLRELLQGAGLEHVEARAIDVSTTFRDFEDYWSPFLGGQGPAPTYCAALSDDRRSQLRERLRTMLPAEADGTIRLMARAFAIRGASAT